MIYRFGDCELDTGLYTLQRGGQTIRLRPKVFRLCLYLLEHRDRVVTRQELCAKVWPEQFISQATLEGVIRTVRQVVGDSGQAQCIIQTLHGYGYRFVAAVEERSPTSMGEPALLASTLAVSSEAFDLAPSEGDVASLAPGQKPEANFDSGRQDGRSSAGPWRNGHGASQRAVSGLGERQASGQRSPVGWRAARVALAVAFVVLLIGGGWALWRGTREPAAGAVG